MNDSIKYDPEDIESLLLNKSFSELYPEERAFVLRHIDSREEYESLRTTLHELRESRLNDEWIEPDNSLKEELMTAFANEKRRGFRLWLNTLFTAPSGPWYRRPSIQIAFGSIVLLLGAVFIVINEKKVSHHTYAELKVPEKTVADSASSENKSETVITDSAETFPAAPRVLAEENSTTSISSTLSSQASEKVVTVTTESAESAADNTTDVKDISVAPAFKTNHVADMVGSDEKSASYNSASSVGESAVNRSETLAETEKKYSTNTTPMQSASLKDVNQLLELLYTAR